LLIFRLIFVAVSSVLSFKLEVNMDRPCMLFAVSVLIVADDDTSLLLLSDSEVSFTGSCVSNL
jgi:hypothetical protein